jgi:ribosome-binding factor A
MSHRKERVGRALRQQIAEILAARVRDPRLSSVTVVEVRPSPDFSFARVFYRTLHEPAAVAAALEGAKPFIRHCLAEVSSLRRVPELDLRLDTSLERAARVDAVLSEIAGERQEKADAVRAGSQAPPGAGYPEGGEAE